MKTQGTDQVVDGVTDVDGGAKGISLSKAVALSLAIDNGTTMNPIITYTGIGTKKIRGIHPKKYRSTRDTIVAGIAKKAEKNIKETYVSG